MNLQPLFTTARVFQAVYRIASTSMLLMYLLRRRSENPEDHPQRRANRLGG